MKIEVRYLKQKTNGLTYDRYEEVKGIDFYDDHIEIKHRMLNLRDEKLNIQTVTKIPKNIIYDVTIQIEKRDQLIT